MGTFDGMPPENDLFGSILSERRPLFLFVVDDEPLAKVIGGVMEYMDFTILRCDTAKCALVTRSLPRAHLIIVNVASSQLTRCGLPPELCEDLPKDPVVVCGKLDKPYLDCDCHPFFLKKPFSVAQFAHALDSAMSRVYRRGFSNLKYEKYDRSEPLSEPEDEPLPRRLPPRADRGISAAPQPRLLGLPNHRRLS